MTGRILFFAKKVARHLLSPQVSDAGDPRYGLVTGGMGSYELKAGEDGTVASVYSDEELGWVSTEHNIDAYFLFRDLGILTGEETYTRPAGYGASSGHLLLGFDHAAGGPDIRSRLTRP